MKFNIVMIIALSALFVQCAGAPLDILIPWGTGSFNVGGRNENVLNFPGLGPTSIAVDQKGFIYVLDAFNMRVLKLDPAGNPAGVINYSRASRKMIFASSISVASDGLLAVCAPSLGAVLAIDGGKINTLDIESDLDPPARPVETGTTPYGSVIAVDRNHGIAFIMERSLGKVSAVSDPDVYPFMDSSGRIYGIRIASDGAVILYRWNMAAGRTESVSQRDNLHEGWKVTGVSILGIDSQDRTVIHAVESKDGENRHVFAIMDVEGRLESVRVSYIDAPSHVLHLAAGPDNSVYAGEIKPAGYRIWQVPLNN